MPDSSSPPSTSPAAGNLSNSAPALTTTVKRCGLGPVLSPIGLDWSDGEPRLRIRGHDDGASELIPLIGLRLNYRADASTVRKCLGHVPWRSDRSGHNYVDCHAQPEPGRRVCSRCAGADGAFAASLHHAHTRGAGEIDPDVARHLQAPNHLYLAAFRDGSIKIGTSTERRLNKRLSEQGAWMARVVARASDGYAVREIEDRVTEALDIGQTVNVTRKLRGLVRPVADSDLESDLEAAAGEVHELLAVVADKRLTASDDRWTNPRAGNPAFVRAHRYPLDLANGTHDFEVVDACGPVAALTRTGSSDVFVTSLKPLFGLVLPLGDFTSDTINLQDSLF